MNILKLFILLTFCWIQCYADINIDEANSLAAKSGNWESIFDMTPKYTIKAGTHTAEQNRKHQKYCAKFGDKDVTDDSDIQVGYDNDDPMNTTIICMGSGTPPPGNLAGAGTVESK